jgi:hypothetical protein
VSVGEQEEWRLARIEGHEPPKAGLEWTSVPRWRQPQRLPDAASYLACSFGDEGRDRVAALLSGAEPRIPVRMAAFGTRWDTQIEATLRRLIGGCLTGVRIVLAGPESVVMRAVAVARELGASAEELVPIADEAISDGYVAEPAGRRVFCPTCRRVFDVTAAIGDVVTHGECGENFIVDHRFSRPHAAYFGWPASLDLHR